jgi:gamma-glutamylcyclotransferase (GGCT)/AIG2-like uncharacterized protein YtfP
MAKYLAQHGTFLGEARIAARLYDLGRFPGMLEAEKPGDWVFGDLYDLSSDPAVLAELDRYEGNESPGEEYFERRLALVQTDDGTHVQAWVYWYRGRVLEANRIVSGRYESNME